MSNCYSLSLPPLMYLSLSVRCRFRHAVVTSAARRHHRRRLLKNSPNHSPSSSPPPAIFKLSDDTLQITLKSPSSSLQKLETKLNQLLDLGREAIDDLRTIAAVDASTGRVVISCRRSTVEFLTVVLISSFVLVVAVRSLFKVRKNVGEELVYRRDRSLGGREVVVSKRDTGWSTNRTSTPLSSDNADYYNQKRRSRTNSSTRKKKREELPRWWPQVVNQAPIEIDNKEGYQKLANQLIQAIMDRKMSGQDISTSDVVQLRYICKTYGVRAFISTENARDSLYRVAVNFVMDYCESIPDVRTSVKINGEDVREFIAGLSDNIGLESYRAARIISAAVAARTRSKILQAWAALRTPDYLTWFVTMASKKYAKALASVELPAHENMLKALEVQNKHSEALAELFKVCLIHRIFPPEENSPEMEMVARSLDKSLNLDQREHILNSFISVCGKDIDQGLVEALGLVGVEDEQENHHV